LEKGVEMDARVDAVIEMMRQRMADDLRARTLAKSVNLSSTRLRQLFKRETGRSPMQHLKDLRMKKCEDMLSTAFLSIKEIAGLVGVRDVSHFVRDFKKKFGVTPTEFRDRSRASRASSAQVSGWRG
jgi:transcriptional regulator GlxA family with amidase domain